MKKKIIALLIVSIVALATSSAKTADQANIQKITCEKTVRQTKMRTRENIRKKVGQTKAQIVKNVCEVANFATENLRTVRYISMEVPNIDTSFKTWMSYKAVTNKRSPQYNYIHTYGWSDEEGFMRVEADEEYSIEQDYYMIALGSFYGTEISTKYRITLDTGKVFYGALADCKDDKHTNSINQYISHNGNVVEFLVDKTKLNKNVRKTGDASAYAPLKGNIIKIEKMIFDKIGVDNK